jgi:HAD superfamily hydrolase (TIGR01509 family)
VTPKIERFGNAARWESEGMVQALVFDFDGLLLDTETPLFEAWTLTYERYGVEPVDLATWRASVGLHDDDPRCLDPLGRLTAHLGGRATVEEIHAYRRAVRDEAIAASDLRPGAIRLLDAADELGVAVAIASSSPVDWVHGHLEARGVIARFAAVSCAGAGVPGKPDPTTYRVACEALGVDPRRALAFEDSPHGVTAARAAGLHCIAVPNPITTGGDFAEADHVVGSLEDVRLRPAADERRAADRHCPLCHA